MAQQPDNILIPLLKAGAIHLSVFALLLVSFNPVLREQPENFQVNLSPIIKATAVSSAFVEKLVKQKNKRLNDAVKAEQDRKRKIRQATERKKQAAIDKKRKKTQADKKRKLDAEKKRKKLADEKKLKADAIKKKADAKKKKEAEALLRQQQIDRDLQTKLNAEASAAKERKVLSELQKYVALIKSRISRYWIESNQTGKCRLEVRLSSSGFVIDVKEVSGLQAICRSAKAAVYKASPLPVSTDPDVFKKMRILDLTVGPKDTQ